LYCRFNSRNSSSSPSLICCSSTGASLRPREAERPEALDKRREEFALNKKENKEFALNEKENKEFALNKKEHVFKRMPRYT
jgi:hypothetical protein